jgi:hypothetical protein
VVVTLEEQQGLTVANDHVLHFRDKNCMVAGILRALQPALQISQRPMQNWSAMRGTIESRTRFLLRPRRLAVRLGVVLGDGALILRKDINPESLPSTKMRMGSSLLVHAHQHQQWIDTELNALAVIP